MKKALIFLLIPFFVHAQELTTIDSDKAHFDGEKMVLSEGVHLEHEMGKVSANHAVLTPSDKNTFLKFEAAELRGDVKVELTDRGTISSDQLNIDLNGRTACFKGDQVHYRDEINQVFADKVTIQYGQDDLNKVLLEGGVKVMTRGGLLLQYVLSDTAEYFPETKTISFKAKAGKRVIFFDQPNNIQMSAPELKIVSGEKQSIQGVGDVRFELIEEELKELKKRFLFGSG